jgi:hypothetical protein
MLKPYPWFRPIETRPARSGWGAIVLRSCVGLLVGALFVATGHPILAGVVIALTLTITGVSLASPKARSALERFFVKFGYLLGRALAFVVLVPLFFVGFTLARAWLWLTGHDPLQLGRASSPTFWLESDREERRVRYIRSTFTTDVLGKRRRPLIATAVVLLIAVIIGELVLRYFGFGRPVLYVADAQAGFYLAPNQSEKRYGGRVFINSHSMRSPEVSRHKPDNTFRVLLIGDSTLYGGSYVDQDEIYSTLLEKRLREAAGPRVEVMNLGVNAWGPFHELGFIDKFGTYGADLAVVCLPIGDIYRPLYGLMEVPFMNAERPPICALEELAAHLAWRYRMSRVGPAPTESLAWQGQQGIQAYCTLARKLREKGCEVFFEVLPSRATILGSAAPGEHEDLGRLREALRTAGFTQVGYSQEQLRAHAAEKYLYHDGVHLHRAGHRVYAEYLHGRIDLHSQKLARFRGTVATLADRGGQE